MPTLADLRRQYPAATEGRSGDPAWHSVSPPLDAGAAFDEVLVSDARSGLTPGQVVDGKFGRALQLEETRRASMQRRHG